MIQFRYLTLKLFDVLAREVTTLVNDIKPPGSYEATWNASVREWLKRLGAKTLFIEPGSPRENGCIGSFNGKLRDEFLNGEIFDTIVEARVITEQWKKQYNTIRPHSSLAYRPPAPEALPYGR